MSRVAVELVARAMTDGYDIDCVIHGIYSVEDQVAEPPNHDFADALALLRPTG